MEEVRGVLVSPPSLCWGGTVTVMGAVIGGAVRGIGSDTEMTTLVGAEEEEGLEVAEGILGNWIVEVGAADDSCGIGTCCGCGMVGSCGVGTTTGSCGWTTAEGTSCDSCWVMVLLVFGFIMSVTVANGLNMLPYMLDML